MTLLHLFRQAEFQVGLAVGVGALLLVLATGRRLDWYLAWAASVVAGMAWTGLLPSDQWTLVWAVLLAAGAIVSGGWGIRVLAGQAPSWSVGVLFALAVLGVWGTVPDTERAAIAMGATLALLVALWPRRAVAIGRVGPFAAVATLAVLAVADGAARRASIVGALGALGMLLVAPAMIRVARRKDRVGGWPLVGAQVALVILSGRVAGRLEDPLPALGIWLLAATLVGVVWWALEGLGRPSPSDSGGGEGTG